MKPLSDGQKTAAAAGGFTSVLVVLYIILAGGPSAVDEDASPTPSEAAQETISLEPRHNPPFVWEQRPAAPYRDYGYHDPLLDLEVQFVMRVDEVCTAESPCPVRVYLTGNNGRPDKPTGTIMPLLDSYDTEPSVAVIPNGLDKDSLPEEEQLPWMISASWVDRYDEECAQEEPCLKPLESFMTGLVPVLQMLPYVDSDTTTWSVIGHSMGGKACMALAYDEKYHHVARFGWYGCVSGVLGPNDADRWRDPIVEGAYLLSSMDRPYVVWAMGTEDFGPDGEGANFYNQSIPAVETIQSIQGSERFTIGAMEGYDHAILPILHEVGQELVDGPPFQLDDPIDPPKEEL